MYLSIFLDPEGAFLHTRTSIISVLSKLRENQLLKYLTLNLILAGVFWSIFVLENAYEHIEWKQAENKLVVHTTSYFEEIRIYRMNYRALGVVRGDGFKHQILKCFIFLPITADLEGVRLTYLPPYPPPLCPHRVK